MSYPGGKGGSGVWQAIINQQPPHTLYAEPFLGGGSVMRMKRPAAENIGIDDDLSAIESFRIATINDGRPVQLIHGDGFDYLTMWRNSISKRALLYLDPPYVPSTRTSQTKLYQNEWDEIGHVRLLELLQGFPCMVQLSGYTCPIYEQMLKDWRVIRFNAMTRGGMREESLWMNYAEPKKLHDYRFFGRNFRERERIGRKTRRWVNRFKALPELEREAILKAIGKG